MTRVPSQRLFLISLISLATICFQLLATKVLAFVFWNHLVYLIISIALLGYGASSTLIAVKRERLMAIPAEIFLAANLVFFSASSLIALLALRFLGLSFATSTGGLADVARSSVPLLVAYFLFLLPFFFSGNIVVYLFFAHPKSSSRLYSYDLIGAAAGCIVFVPLITRSGAVGGILLCLLVTLASAVLMLRSHFEDRQARSLAAFAGVLFVGMLVVYPMRDTAISLNVDSSKVLGLAHDLNPGTVAEYSAWDVVTRLDILSNEHTGMQIGWTKIAPEHKLVTFDGDAISHIPSRSNDFPREEDYAEFERSSYYVPLLKNSIGGDHLLIGLGGGPDISTALLLRAKSVTGVDINGALIHALKTRFADFGGNVFNRDNVRIVHSEGRSFLRREQRQFDLIFMSGTDTFTALSTGAYVLAENFLYTTDALRDYYSHLSPNGSLFVLRWFFNDKPRESLRLFATALEALRQEGVADPEKHLVVVRDMRPGGFSPGLTILRKQPWSETEAAGLMDEILANHASLRPVYFPLPPGASRESFIPEARFYHELEQAFVGGTEQQFYDRYEYDVTPVPDDRPFFFKYYKLSTMLRETWQSMVATGPIHGYWGYLVFLIILVTATVAVTLFIWIPLWCFQREGVRSRGSAWATAYFAALGVGFIMLEITLMQKLALFLGHPMYSLSTVLGGMLLFAGIGSHLAGRWSDAPLAGIVRASIGVGGMAVLLVLFSEPLAGLFLGWTLAARIVVSLVLIGPLAIALGFFFPLGLRLVEERDSRYIPWAWGINSGFTVIGSILAIMIAMVTGFSFVILLAALIYGGGLAAIRQYASLSEEAAVTPELDPALQT